MTESLLIWMAVGAATYLIISAVIGFIRFLGNL